MIPQVAGSGAGRYRSKQGVDFVQRRLAFCQCKDFSGFLRFLAGGGTVDHAADHLDEPVELAAGNADFLAQRLGRRRRIEIAQAILGFKDIVLQPGDERLLRID